MFFSLDELWSRHAILFWVFVCVVCFNLVLIFWHLWAKDRFSESYESEPDLFPGGFFFLCQVLGLWGIVFESGNSYTFGASVGFTVFTLVLSWLCAHNKKVFFIAVNMLSGVCILFLKSFGW